MKGKRWIDSQIWQQCEQAYLAEPQAFLALQDEYDINVNLLLLAEQLDRHAHHLTSSVWQQLATEIRHWEQSIVQPYRQLRKLAKANLQHDEYQQMLNVELMLERKSQRFILHKLVQLQPYEPTQASGMNNYNVNTYVSDFNIAEELIQQWCHR